MELYDVMRTTAAIREFTDDPLPDEVLGRILDHARFAPSGGNRQPWRVAVVKDPTVRRQLADLMTSVWHEYLGQETDSTRAPFAFGRSTGAPPVAAPNGLLDNIEQVPVVLAVAADLNKIALMDGDVAGRPPITGGASIYPFGWSVLLAARARGLGGVMTTFLSRAETQAAPILGLPEGHALVATIFLGQPVHQNTKLRRGQVSDFTTIDRFDGEPLR